MLCHVNSAYLWGLGKRAGALSRANSVRALSLFIYIYLPNGGNNRYWISTLDSKIWISALIIPNFMIITERTKRTLRGYLASMRPGSGIMLLGKRSERANERTLVENIRVGVIRRAKVLAN